MERFFAALRSLVYVPLFLLLWWWIAVNLRPLDRWLGVQLPGGVETVGIIVVVLGGLIALACVVSFIVRGRGTPAVFDAPRTLVAQGPYRYVRNPMYIGGFLLLVGLALLYRSPSILVLALLFLVIAHLFIVRVEEPGLVKRFGESYSDYMKNVPRWVPRFPQRHA